MGAGRVALLLQRRLSDPGRAYWDILLTGFVFWLAAFALIAPNFGETDVYVFKEAGCNLAMGRGFTALALPGMTSAEPQLFAAYAPGLPLLFGLFAALFGCNGYANTYFDLLLAAAATFAVAWAIRPAIPQRWQLPLAALMAAALPFGMVLAAGDRPETIGLALFVAACGLAASRRPHADSEAAALAGLALLFYPFGGALAGLGAWAVGSQRATAFDIGREARRALKMIGVFLIPAALTLALYAAIDGTAFARFAGHAFGDNSGAGAVMHAPYLQLLRHAAFSAGLYSLMSALSFLLAVAISGFLMARAMRENGRTLWPLAAALAAFVIIPLAIFPSQNNYQGFVRIALPVTMALGLHTDSTLLRRGLAVLVALVCLANLPIGAMRLLTRAQTSAGYEQAHVQAERYAALAHARRRDGPFIVPVNVYFLYKPVLGTLINPDFAVRAATARDGVIVCPFGRPPGADNPNMALAGPGFAHTTTVESHYVLSLAGRRLGNSEWGWSCDGYLKP